MHIISVLELQVDPYKACIGPQLELVYLAEGPNHKLVPLKLIAGFLACSLFQLICKSVLSVHQTSERPVIQNADH